MPKKYLVAVINGDRMENDIFEFTNAKNRQSFITELEKNKFEYATSEEDRDANC